MPYTKPYILREKLGNNAFAYDIRENKTLTIPSLIEGTIDDVLIGDVVVFEESDNGILKSCKGLKNFIHLIPLPSIGLSDQLTNPLSDYPTIRLSDYPTIPPITIFDNHNHALYFWLEAIRVGKVGLGIELIHIDEHSDLWGNENTLDLEKAVKNPSYAWEFTNLSCNVGNYISPAIQSGLVGKMIRIENEYELDQYIDYTPSENSVLNLDLDIFAPELDFMDERKKIECIRNLMKKVKCVTIATSPYFIDQGRAIEKLQAILE